MALRERRAISNLRRSPQVLSERIEAQLIELKRQVALDK
jgi:hypothetical protein